MKNRLFNEDYHIKTEDDQNKKVPDYESNIQQMQILMRSKNYLNSPEDEANNTSLDGKLEIDEAYLDITNIAIQQRCDNVLTVMRSNDFLASFKSQKLDIFDQPSNNPLDSDTKIKILIAAEESVDYRENLYEYWTKLKKQPNYNAEAFIDSLVDKSFVLSDS